MSAIKTYTPDTLAKEIKSAVEWLKEEDCGCVTLKLNGTLAVCVGWSDGFDPEDETVIHSKTEPTWAICAAIKAWGSDDLRTDLDYIDAPYYEDGSVYDTEESISPDENYEWLATNFLNEFDVLKEMDIDEKGLIHEQSHQTTKITKTKIRFPVILKIGERIKTMKTLNELVKDYLAENHAWCKKADGNYHFEIDIDYRDEIEDSIAQEILESNSPRDTLIERLWDWYQTDEWDIVDNLVDDFRAKTDPELLEDANIIEDGNLNDEMIRDEIMDLIYVDYPEDWALSQEFCFNIIVSNGDDNYDFWLNEHIIDKDGNVDENAEKSGLVWLVKQQGYTLEELVEILKNGDIKEPKTFFETVLQEVANGYGCEALTFCVKMTLGQAIALKERMESNQNGSIVLDKRVECGLFDPWEGGGSVLEIACEKDVEIPFENIWKFYIDERRSNRYDSIHNVYGTDSSLWRDCLKEIKA